MRVCVVMERDKRDNRESLYGVFTTLAAAQKDYGAPEGFYDPLYVMCELNEEESA